MHYETPSRKGSTTHPAFTGDQLLLRNKVLNGPLSATHTLAATAGIIPSYPWTRTKLYHAKCRAAEEIKPFSFLESPLVSLANRLICILAGHKPPCFRTRP